MRTFLMLIMSALSCLGQGGLLGYGNRNPAINAQYQVFTSNDVYALSPDWWFMSSVGVFTNSATPTDGQKIDTWNDISANARHLQQGNTSRRPMYRTGMVNGYPGIDFGIATSANMTNPFAAVLTQPGAIFAVVRLTNTSSGSVLTYSYNATFQRWEVLFNPNTQVPAFYSGTQFSADIAVLPLNWFLCSFVFDGNTTGYRTPASFRTKIYVNGKKTGQGDSNTNNNNNGLEFGNDVGFVNSFKGQVAEAIQFSSRRVTDSIRIGVEMYLAKKYALQCPF